jgi:pimeloyl-ACP methyl ester carboxylesterase
MESQIAETSKGPIEYTVLGIGPTVLACHGTSSDCFSTYTSAPLVEAGFRVLIPSRPGYGQTPLSVGRTAAEAAGALVTLLDALGIQTCSVVAISGGGPTGLSLAAGYPARVARLVLMEAISHTETRSEEPGYAGQVAFYGPMHFLFWHTLRVFGRLSPRNTARQTLAIFSTHDPEDTLRRLSRDDILKTCAFFRGRSSRKGALNDLTHTVGVEVLHQVIQPTLVVHSREDRAVPFSHAEWSLENIPEVRLCESGFTGHFYWIGPDYPRVVQAVVRFLGGHSGRDREAGAGSKDDEMAGGQSR